MRISRLGLVAVACGIVVGTSIALIALHNGGTRRRARVLVERDLRVRVTDTLMKRAVDAEEDTCRTAGLVLPYWRNGQFYCADAAGFPRTVAEPECNRPRLVFLRGYHSFTEREIQRQWRSRSVPLDREVLEVCNIQLRPRQRRLLDLD